MPPVVRVVGRVDDAKAQAGRGGKHAVQAGRVDHVEDGADSPALLADEPGSRVVVLDLGGGVRAIAQLVLEPLQVHRVAGAVGQDLGQQEAARAGRRLGQDHEEVAHRGRREPLVAGDAVAAVGRPCRRRGVGADVRATLLLRHGHAGGQAPLGGRRPPARVVLGDRQQRLVLLRQVGGVAERGDDRVGHRDRAEVAGLGLAPEVEPGGTVQVRAWTPVLPRCRVQAVSDRRRHEVVPGGMELHLVDPVAVPVVRAELRRVLVGEPAQLLRALAARQAADLLEAPAGDRGAAGAAVPSGRKASRAAWSAGSADAS